MIGADRLVKVLLASGEVCEGGQELLAGNK